MDKIIVVLSNKCTTYKQKKNIILNLQFFLYFPGNHQKIAKLFTSGIFNVVVFLEVILLFSNDVT